MATATAFFGLRPTAFQRAGTLCLDGFNQHQREEPVTEVTITGTAPSVAPVREDPSSSRAVATAFHILDLLVRRPDGARLSELSRELGVPKSTALRILVTLCEIGVVRQGATKTYRIGPRLLDYAKAPLGLEPDMVREFYRIARPIHAELNETIQLAVLSAPDVTFLAHLDSTRAVRLVTHVGRRLPAHATATGKAILAFSDPVEVERLLTAGLTRHTDHTITDPATFLDVLDAARRNGYATEVEETSANLSCYSAPVFGPDGLVRAGITICVPTGHVSPDRATVLIGAVREGARELSAAL